jgi:hypothetical protein
MLGGIRIRGFRPFTFTRQFALLTGKFDFSVLAALGGSFDPFYRDRY